MEGGKPTIITNAEGQRTMPSAVAYTKNGDRLVGQIATREAVVNHENKFFSAKRFIVRKMSEVDDKSKKVSYRATRDDNGLENGALEFLNDKITKVVVIVPAYFNGLQRTHEPASSMSLVVFTHVESNTNCIGPTIVDKLAYEVSGKNTNFGTPTNPVVLNRVRGDSSSGTTVAVAANFVDFSLSIDTSGDHLFDQMRERAAARFFAAEVLRIISMTYDPGPLATKEIEFTNSPRKSEKIVPNSTLNQDSRNMILLFFQLDLHQCSAPKPPSVSPQTTEEIEARIHKPKFQTEPTLPIYLKFTNVTYKVVLNGMTKGVAKDILKGITGCVNPSEVLELMGPSGSGKTSLLNLIGARLHQPTMGGSITYNYQPYSKFLTSRIEFVRQDDVLFPYLTVKEDGDGN
ncbi:uncharacterized protein LOC131648568 [Vicia villosa]|uniref:uncharacterized protein LOC131648568 n=1 Tax=Vicia villosa TaxID=3911 RepID=UPI00273B7DA3|nr:uncharacterized protein LOC131648568 [Vicia villosa]